MDGRTAEAWLMLKLAATTQAEVHTRNLLEGAPNAKRSPGAAGRRAGGPGRGAGGGSLPNGWHLPTSLDA